MRHDDSPKICAVSLFRNINQVSTIGMAMQMRIHADPNTAKGTEDPVEFAIICVLHLCRSMWFTLLTPQLFLCRLTPLD